MEEIYQFFSKLFDSSDWPPRWHCGNWTGFEGWLYLISDLLIWSAYFAIPVTIIKYISRRQHPKFVRLYFLFAAFILACGATHFLDAFAFWIPMYRLSALVRFITAAISWTTVFFIVKYLPILFSLKTPDDLETEISQRIKSEEKFRGLLEAAPDAIVISNEKGEIILINRQAEKLFGYTKEELAGKPVEMLVPAELRNRHIADRSDYFVNPKVRAMGAGLELLAVRKDGAKVPVEISLSPLVTEEGILISAAIRDITARKQLEEKLKKVNRDHELLVRNVKDYAIFMLDKDGLIASWNSGAENIKGYNAAEIIGKPMDIFYTMEDRQRGEPKRILQMALERGSFEAEGWRLKKDGTAFWANVALTALYDEEGMLYGYAKVTKDITEKRKAEAYTRFLATIADSIQDPVISTDSNLLINKWNESAEALLEWKAEEVIAKETAAILKTIYPSETREQILASFEEKGYWQGEVIYHTKSGKPLHVLATASRLKDADGNITGNLILAKDITERKKAEAALSKFNEELEQRVKDRTADIRKKEAENRLLNEQLEMKVIERTKQLETANKELEAFSYSVSHDLRAPLRAISGYSKILEEDYGSILDAEGKRIIDAVIANSKRMGLLIDDLLRFSKMARMSVQPFSVDMYSIVSECVKELVTDTSNMRINIDPNLPEANVDHAMIKQVWINLISNAIKYSAKKTSPLIEIGYKKENGVNIYFIRDNGAGFNMKYANKLFGVFQRLHGHDEFDGTGVGLALVSRIIHKHNGLVWGEGEEGVGATFYFSLPAT
ncbi:MAG TPA: PAS domain S-box protein [Panacibacter sp.]|mgnify:CR=1 FL=1|nr:PAS domain S-box protein [Panacibacter sp.]HNP45448.1 PAS domain S-box protein [Panacibacter sp.]